MAHLPPRQWWGRGEKGKVGSGGGRGGGAGCGAGGGGVGEGVLSYTTACKYNEVLCLLAISIAKNQLYHLRPPHPPWWWRWSLASWRLVKAVYGIASVDELTTTAEHRDSAA